MTCEHGNVETDAHCCLHPGATLDEGYTCADCADWAALNEGK